METGQRPHSADHDEPGRPIAGVPSVLASLTQGGLNGATKSLAIEYAKRGIRVNAVARASSRRL
jgi:NAD(P)-dependent dehydrogenase (short-subunit alcohol dehydrogenase family)